MFTKNYESVDRKDSITEDSWSSYTFKTGLRSDAFKQYLRDRGIYFEPSQAGEYTHFEVKNADEAVDRRVNEIIKTVSDSLAEDAHTKYYLRRIRDKYTFSGVRGMWDEEITSYSFKKQENIDMFISILKKFVDFNMTKSELLSRGPGFVMRFNKKVD